MSATHFKLFPVKTLLHDLIFGTVIILRLRISVMIYPELIRVVFILFREGISTKTLTVTYAER